MLNVIIPVYKARETLPNALDSLVAQTFKRFFVTISQDGDGEDYSDIITEYKRRGLHINHIDCKENGGPGMARQRGIDLSISKNYDYVMFLDADDIVTPRAVEVLYKEIQKNLVDIMISSFIAENEHDSQMLEADKTPITWCHGKMYRLKYLQENNIRFLDELKMNEDSYFNLVAVNLTEKKMRINEYTYVWRYNKESLTRDGESEAFFLKSWEQYIYSQVKGIQKIINIKGNINDNVFCATILNIYYHLQRASYFNIDYSHIVPLLTELKEMPEVQDLISRENFWLGINSSLKSCGFVDKTLFFYKERFIDWFKLYIADEKKEES